MRSKAPLMLMEQMVMLLVFALAAALCLQAFAKSDELSREIEARDRAATLCQSAAEVIRHCGGDGETALAQAAETLGARSSQSLLWLDYDGGWNPCAAVEGVMYRLYAQETPSGVPGLEKAHVWVVTGGGPEEILFELDVAWQGVSGHG